MYYTYVLFLLIIISAFLGKISVLRNFSVVNAIILSFVAFIFVGLRIDTGNDYLGYTQLHNDLVYGYDLRHEFLFKYIFKLFDYESGYILAIASFFFLTITFFAVSLRSHASLTAIVFCFFTSGFVFLAIDQIRQALAITIIGAGFILTLKTEKRVYSLLAVLAGSLFHYFSLLAVLISVFHNVFLKLLLPFLIISIVLLALHFTYDFSWVQSYVLQLVPKSISSHYTSREFLFEQQRGTGLAILFFAIPIYLISFEVLFSMRTKFRNARPSELIYNDRDYYIVVSILSVVIFGFILKIFFYDNHILSRGANYFLYLAPFLYVLFLANSNFRLVTKSILTISLLFSFIIQCYLQLGMHGAFPFQHAYF